MARYTMRFLLCVISVCTGCGVSSAPPVPVVDFLKDFDRAERRPADSYILKSGDVRPSIEGPAPGRLIWVLPIPRRGTFQAFVAVSGSAAVRFRVGVSDERIYEQLAQVIVGPEDRGWKGLDADLSPYAGWKWSLFYRPERVIWRLILSADAVAGIPTRVMWGAPQIITDASSAREYRKRRLASR